jgi:threonine synthase
MDHASKIILTCVNCQRSYNENEVQYLCPACAATNSSHLPPKGILKVEYDYKHIKILRDRKYSLYEKYLPLMPFHSPNSLPNLKIGDTPVYKVVNKNLDVQLFIKDDSQNPTYSFKDRASAMVSAVAREKGIDRIVTASTGNAGSSIAGICAAQGQHAIVLVPANAPIAKLTQILMYGAQIIAVEGTYDDAFDLSIALSHHTGWYNRNTAFNPITIEGKKTVALEIYEQFSPRLPDYIYVPVGDGAILAGVYKGFEDLLKIGLIEKIPVVIAVQADLSANIINNLNNDIPAFPAASSIADSINVTIPRNFYMAIEYLKKYNGIGMEVTNEEILQASQQIARSSGIFAEPAAAAAFAGFSKNHSSTPEDSTHLILLTGCGLKDLHSIQSILPHYKPIPCDMNAVKNILNI